MITFEQPKVVCLTPVKNEAWILHHFLTAASLWADHIIIADQGSTDGSIDIAATFPRVIIVRNPADKYNESKRQQLLIASARQLPGPRILVALDADEFLSPRLAAPHAISNLIKLVPGGYLRVPWLNVCPGLREGWIGHRNFIAGWNDNGREHDSSLIHGKRLPVLANDREIDAGQDAFVMHWQFTAIERMRSKHRWYLAWERVHQAGAHPIKLYRQYHHMNAVRKEAIISISPHIFDWYRKYGVTLEDIHDDEHHWWDAQVISWMEHYGTKHFAWDSIWDCDWEEIARLALNPKPGKFGDPRSARQRLIHLWLQRTQPFHRNLAVRIIDNVIQVLSR